MAFHVGVLLFVLGLVCKLLGHNFNEVVDLVHETSFQVLEFVLVSSSVNITLQLLESVINLHSKAVEFVLEGGQELSESL